MLDWNMVQGYVSRMKLSYEKFSKSVNIMKNVYGTNMYELM